MIFYLVCYYLGAKEIFDTETLKCLVCQSLVEEINFAIDKVIFRSKIKKNIRGGGGEWGGSLFKNRLK